jgi:acetyl/propionyl-CoA carboxylase alpha subunit
LTKQINAIKAPIDIGNQCNSRANGKRKRQLILEAMKMENSFLSPRDGIIKSISVIWEML